VKTSPAFILDIDGDNTYNVKVKKWGILFAGGYQPALADIPACYHSLGQ
jgi:hypothetical protein